MKFLDISGFGHSGKTSVADIIKEFEGYQLPDYNFEFNLIRIQGGLLDLKFALVDNWSPIRSDAAIRRFYKLVNRIGPRASLFSPSTLFLSNGMNYDSYFNGRFTKISHDYLLSLICSTQPGYWPFYMIDELPIKQFVARVRGALGLGSASTNIYLSDAKDFLLKTNKYLFELFANIKLEDTEVFVLLNAIEPFHSHDGLSLLGQSKQIVVQRDPRDIYASALNANNGYVPKFETRANMNLKKKIVGENVDLFIKRQKVYFENMSKSNNEDSVMRVSYEDVVLNYDKFLVKLYHFLGETPSVHKNKGKYFEPFKSRRNIGLWKDFNDQSAISRIEKSLSEYCYFPE